MKHAVRRQLDAAMKGLQAEVRAELSYVGWTADQSAQARHTGPSVAPTAPGVAPPAPSPAPQAVTQAATATPWPVSATPAAVWSGQPFPTSTARVDRARRHGPQLSTPAQEGISR